MTLTASCSLVLFALGLSACAASAEEEEGKEFQPDVDRATSEAR